MRPKKHVNITLSFPSDLNALLHAKVSKGEISQYVVRAVRESLEAGEKNELRKLEAAYEEANKDPDRLELINDWMAIDNEDTTEGWTWSNE